MDRPPPWRAAAPETVLNSSQELPGGDVVWCLPGGSYLRTDIDTITAHLGYGGNASHLQEIRRRRSRRVRKAARRAPSAPVHASDTSFVAQQALGTAEPSQNTITSAASQNPNLIPINNDKMFRFGGNENAQNANAFIGVPGASAANFVKNDEVLSDFAALSNAANDIAVQEDETATEARDKDGERLRAGENLLQEIAANGLNPDNIQRAKAHLETAMKEHQNDSLKSGMEASDFPKAMTDWSDRPATPNGGPEYLSHFRGSPKMAEKYRLMGDKLDLKRDLRSPVYNEKDYECPDTPPTPGGQMMEDHWNERKLETDPLEKDYWRSMDPTYHFTKKAYKTAAKLLVESHGDTSLVPGAKAVGLSLEDVDSMTREEIKEHLDAHTPGCRHPFCLEDRNAAIIGLGALEYNHNGKIIKTKVDKAADPFTEDTEQEEVTIRKTGTHQYNNLGHARTCNHEDCIRKRKAFTPEWEPLSAEELEEQAETMARWDDRAEGFEDADKKAAEVLRGIKESEREMKKHKLQFKEDQKRKSC